MGDWLGPRERYDPGGIHPGGLLQQYQHLWRRDLPPATRHCVSAQGSSRSAMRVLCTYPSGSTDRGQRSPTHKEQSSRTFLAGSAERTLQAMVPRIAGSDVDEITGSEARGHAGISLIQRARDGAIVRAVQKQFQLYDTVWMRSCLNL